MEDKDIFPMENEIENIENMKIEDMSIEQLKSESCRLANKIDDMEKEIREHLMSKVKERRERCVELDKQLEEVRNI